MGAEGTVGGPIHSIPQLDGNFPGGNPEQKVREEDSGEPVHGVSLPRNGLRGPARANLNAFLTRISSIRAGLTVFSGSPRFLQRHRSASDGVKSGRNAGILFFVSSREVEKL